MRISMLAMLLTFSGLLMAKPGTGQDLNKIMISLDLKNASLKQALKKIESVTQLAFTYRTVDVAAVEHINYQATNTPVTQVLEDLLQHTGLKYDQVNSNIVIKKSRNKEKVSDVSIAADVPFEGGIRGRVTDETGSPLPNASILLIGSDKGTAADSKGEFVISGVKAGEYRLQVSAVGFQTLIKDVTINDDAVAEVAFKLVPGNNKLDEVVVTALGIKREKRSLGYSTQEIKGEELGGTRQTNVLNAMRGK
ncbi:MAG TPA: carboxypeptidase-like regulatory domain-containing protein, partial [Niastella sp.]|nr:carboxypeptidase-like regulatory domain-containing protein [Niastella sp.]